MLAGLGRYQVGHYKKHPTQNHLEMDRLNARGRITGATQPWGHTLEEEDATGWATLTLTGGWVHNAHARAHTHTHARTHTHTHGRTHAGTHARTHTSKTRFTKNGGWISNIWVFFKVHFKKQLWADNLYIHFFICMHLLFSIYHFYFIFYHLKRQTSQVGLVLDSHWSTASGFYLHFLIYIKKRTRFILGYYKLGSGNAVAV